MGAGTPSTLPQLLGCPFCFLRIFITSYRPALVHRRHRGAAERRPLDALRERLVLGVPRMVRPNNPPLRGLPHDVSFVFAGDESCTFEDVADALQLIPSSTSP